MRFGRAIVVIVASLAVLGAQRSVTYGHTRPTAKLSFIAVRITPTGTVHGTVTVSPPNKTCHAAICKYAIAPRKTVRLTERATNPSTWPFKGWKVNGKKRGKAATITLKAGPKGSIEEVVAVYAAA